jgi:6-phosphogluconolactonase
MTPEILIDTAESLAQALAVRFTETTGRAIAERGLFSLALPGGSVATTFFPSLARAQVDWSRVSFFWGDERALPPTHPESNYAAAEQLWLRPAAVPATRIHRMPADSTDLEGAADAYAEELVRVLGSPPVLDLVLLGMGPDGHVCSLFPDHPLLHEYRRWVAAIVDSPKPPPRRLTFTLPVLAAARQVVLVATGAAKAEAVHGVVMDPSSPLPAAIVMRAAGDRGVLLLDQAAAALT